MDIPTKIRGFLIALLCMSREYSFFFFLFTVMYAINSNGFSHFPVFIGSLYITTIAFNLFLYLMCSTLLCSMVNYYSRFLNGQLSSINSID